MNRLQKLATLTILGSILVGVSAPSIGADDEWVSLFDGKTLSGWTTAEARPATGRSWTGRSPNTGRASHLFSPRGDYKNFHYRAEIKINDKGNSGMYFRTQKGPGFPKGYEAQVNSTHGDPVKTGSLYNHVKFWKCWFHPILGSPRRSKRSAITSSSRSMARRRSITSIPRTASRRATSPSSTTTQPVRSRFARSRSRNSNEHASRKSRDTVTGRHPSGEFGSLRRPGALVSESEDRI